MHCKKCETENLDSAKFCKQCGRSFLKTQNQSQTTTQRKTGKWRWIVGGIIAIAIIIGVAVMVKNASDKRAEERANAIKYEKMFQNKPPAKLEFKEESFPDSYKNMLDQQNVLVKQKAEDLLKKVLIGEDFAALAKEFSQDPSSKDNGGDLGFIKKGTFGEAEFDTMLFDPNFKVGDVLPTLFENQTGLHIIKKIEERGEGDTLEIHAADIAFAKQSIEQYPELMWTATGLTGKNLKSASVDYRSQGVGSPQVALQFDGEGTKLFADITKRNIGKPVAIFLDKEIISQPTVQNEIVNGQAVITGNFTINEVKALVWRLNNRSE